MSVMGAVLGYIGFKIAVWSALNTMTGWGHFAVSLFLLHDFFGHIPASWFSAVLAKRTMLRHVGAKMEAKRAKVSQHKRAPRFSRKAMGPCFEEGSGILNKS